MTHPHTLTCQRDLLLQSGVDVEDMLDEVHLMDVAQAHVHVIIIGILAAQDDHIGVCVTPKVFYQPEVIELNHINLTPINLVGVAHLAYRHKITIHNNG